MAEALARGLLGVFLRIERILWPKLKNSKSQASQTILDVGHHNSLLFNNGCDRGSDRLFLKNSLLFNNENLHVKEWHFYTHHLRNHSIFHDQLPSFRPLFFSWFRMQLKMKTHYLAHYYRSQASRHGKIRRARHKLNFLFSTSDHLVFISAWPTK